MSTGEDLSVYAFGDVHGRYHGGRDAALSAAKGAHAQAGEKLGQLDGALGDSDDQMVKLKEKDAEDSQDEIP